MVNENLLRIGELSRRTGVTPEVLRAWERRYGLFAPQRTDGGFRLYSAADIGRINMMKRLLAEGVSASEAAHRIASGPIDSPVAAPVGSLFEARRDALAQALFAYDEASAHEAIDRVLMEFDAEVLMRFVFLPLLTEVGQRWEEGTLSVAQEHFASNLIRRRLSGLARGWEAGVGPRALLACPPDEEHDIPLLMFGIGLGHRGWRITYLGQRTPADELLSAVEALRPELVVLASPRQDAYRELIARLGQAPRGVRVAIAGAGATADLAERMGALLIEGDPISAAERVASWTGVSE